MNTPVTRLTDYRPPDYLIETTDLIFLLDFKRTIVTCRQRIRRAAEAKPDKPLQLDGRRLELLAVKLDGKRLEPAKYQLHEHELILPGVPESFSLEIVTALDPAANSSLEGLYASGSMLCTQCEPHGFSRITYFPDRPDVACCFTVRIEADKSAFPVLLSNGNPVASGHLSTSRHYAVWRDPFKKPAYLFALVAGRLIRVQDHFVTASGRKVAIHFYVEEGNQQRCGHAIGALQRAMAWEEREYGLEYDLDLYQVVAVGDFNFGAMENKGLNIFNSKYVLADPETATDADYEAVESVIAHEYLHNWTGNRVTCRDWFQLSLKEGLTVFRDQQYGATAFPGGGQRVREVKRLQQFQFPEDAGPLAHPVQPVEYVEINNFYTTTIYEKGAEIVRMLFHLLGREQFVAGLRLYLARHDGRAATIDDFLAALSESSGFNLKQFRRWYEQAGTPRVTVERRWAEKSRQLELVIKQETPPTPGQNDKKPLHLPLTVAFLDHEGRPLVDARVLELKENIEVFTFTHCPEKPLLSIGRGFSAPIRIICDHNPEELARLALVDDDPFARWRAMRQLATRAILDRSNQPPDENFYASRHNLVFGALCRQHWPAAAADGMAEILELPDNLVLCEELEQSDPYQVAVSRRDYQQSLAQQWEKELLQLYQANQTPGPYLPSPADMARRHLKNLALHYLCSAGAKGPGAVLCREQYRKADNLNDRQAALAGLLQIFAPADIPELDSFYHSAAGNELLKDRWFMLQAAAGRPETIDTLRQLLKHPDFSYRRPNRVRAALGTFAANTLAFHQPDGSGYHLLAGEILNLDRLNPQVAARLATALSSWRRFAPAFSSRMREELSGLKTVAGLSPDLMEIVDKSID